MANKGRAQDAASSESSSPSIAYIHPVRLMLHRLEQALLKTSALSSGLSYSKGDGRAYHREYFHPALRAVEHAQGAAIGIGQSLRFGMRDRAGVTETKLHTLLDTLLGGIYTIKSGPPPAVKCRFWDPYEKLEYLHRDLELVAVEPEPTPWPKKLRGFYNALLRVRDGMRTLYEAAEDDAKDPVELWKQVCKTVLPDFGQVAVSTLPQLVYATEVAGCDDFYEYDKLPDRLFTCCQRLMVWGQGRHERPTADDPFEPSDQYQHTRNNREALITWIGQFLDLDEAKEARKPACQAGIVRRRRGRPPDPQVRARDRAIAKEYKRDRTRSPSEIAATVAQKFPGVPCGPDQARKAIDRLEKNAPPDAVKRSN